MKFIRKKILVLFCLLTLSLSHFAYGKVPFTNLDGHALMAAGSKENKSLFLFDTGAGITVVSDSFCRAANCKTIFWIPVSDYVGERKWHRVVRISDFYIGDLHFKNVNAILVKSFARELARFSCAAMPVEGILGANLLKQYCWELSYRDSTYRTAKTPIHLENVQPLTLRLKKGIPYIKALPFNGVAVNNILFDTGDVNDIVLRPRTFKQLFSEKIYATTWEGASLNSFASEPRTIQVYRGEVAVLSDSHQLIVGAIAGVRRNGMGSGFLANSVVAINYSNKTLEIDKAALASPPCGYRRAGIRYAFYAKRQVIEVEEVLAEVSQRHPELQVGTILKTINGKSCQEVAAMPPCERHSFLRLLGCGGLEVVTSVGNVYSLPAIY